MVSKEFAVKIDTELSELHYKHWILISELQNAIDYLRFYEKHYPTEVDKIQQYNKEIDKAESAINDVNDEINKLNAIYNQDPWTRAFLVIASNGHVHKSRDCSTCFPTTRYQWLVQYSNDDESVIVEDAGQDACTICYPSAPADVLNRPSRIVTADKIAKAEAKAERDAKKAERIAKEKANAPTISGEFLYIKDGKYTQVIKTERSAVTEWFSQYDKSQREIVTHYYDGKAHSEESIQEQKDRKAHAGEIAQLICYRLAEKHGIGYEEQEAILIKKHGKRGRY